MNNTIIPPISLYTVPVNFYPLFDIAHFILTAKQIRLDTGPQFARQHPLTSCSITVISCYAGSLLTNFILGKPVIGALQRQSKFLICLAIWIATNFWSKFQHMTNSRLCSTICHSMKEVYRARKILRGMEMASEHFPDNLVIQIVTGMVKGNGGGMLRILARWLGGGGLSERINMTTWVCGVVIMVLIVSRDVLVYTLLVVGMVVFRILMINQELKRTYSVTKKQDQDVSQTIKEEHDQEIIHNCKNNNSKKLQ